MLDVGTFNSTFMKAIAKTFYNQAGEAMKYSVMSQIFDVQDTTEYTEAFTSIEATNNVDRVEESWNYPESWMEKGYKTAFESAEFGHKLVITKKARNKERDVTEKILQLANKQKNYAIVALHHFLEKNTSEIFNQAFSSTKYLAPDWKVLCASDHSWNSTPAGKTYKTWSNLLSASALDLTQVDAVEKKAWDFKDATGDQKPLHFQYVMVKKGWTASRQALKIFARKDAMWQYLVSTIWNLNIYQGAYMVIENPWMTSDTAYFFLTWPDTEIERSIMARFVERPRIQTEFKERENLDWYTVAGWSMKYGIRNQPYDILWSAWA